MCVVKCLNNIFLSFPQFLIVVSRAVKRLNGFVPWVQNRFDRRTLNARPNGILYLKGGDLQEELAEVSQLTEVIEVSQWFPQSFFETKAVVYVKMKTLNTPNTVKHDQTHAAAAMDSLAFNHASSTRSKHWARHIPECDQTEKPKQLATQSALF